MTVPLELEIDLNHNQFAIDTRSTILEALKRMDENNCKLLIVNKDGVYSTLITIGDIQRAIIQNISLSTPLMDVHIQPKVVCLDTDSDDTIKKHLKNMRSQFMPVLNKEGHLVRIVFWEELLESKDLSLKKPLNLPVVIMAGGKGLRLKPISNIIPKPLIPIGDKTIVENIMDRFIDSGCSKFHLTVNYKKELIQHYFETHGNYDITYYVEDKPLGTVGSLQLLKNELKTPFFVSNCDILIEQDYHDLYQYHRDNKNEITLVVALKNYSIPYGTVESGEDGILENISEKPEFTFKINAGMYLLEPHLLNEIPENTFFHITELISNIKARGGRVGVFPVSEKSWVDIGEWPEYIQTVRNISRDTADFKGI